MGSKAGHEPGAGATELSGHVHPPGTSPHSRVKPVFRLRPLQLGLSLVYRYLTAMGNIQETTERHTCPQPPHALVCAEGQGVLRKMLQVFSTYAEKNNFFISKPPEIPPQLVSAVIFIETETQSDLDQI